MTTTTFILINLLVIAISGISIVRLQHNLKQTFLFFQDKKLELVAFFLSVIIFAVSLIVFVIKIADILLSWKY